MTVKIDKGVPMPSGRSKYPWREMEINDSFFVSEAARQAIASTASYFSSRNPPFKFRIRTVTENGVKGIRVWRIA